MPRATAEDGQSTLEYTAVLAVVALLVTVAAAAAMAPTYVNATLGGFSRALCVVTGRECRALRQQACTVRSGAEGRTFSASVLFVRLEDGRLLLQERLSDGRVRITLTDANAIGAEGEIGASAGVNWKGLRFDASATANASVVGLLGRGRVYLARDTGHAQRLVRALQSGDAPAPDASFHEGGLRGEASATASGGAGLGGGLGSEAAAGAGPSESRGGGDRAVVGAAAEVAATLRRAVGRRVDHRTGETTWYVSADNEASASAGASVLGAARVQVDGRAQGNGLLRIITDRSGRIVALGAQATYGARAGGQAAVKGAGARGSGRLGDGDRHEIEVTADPDDPAVLAALRRVQADPGPAALRALTQAVYDRGRIDRRTYEVAEEVRGASASAALGVKLGGGYEQTALQSRLIDASTRPPDGVWERRFDCIDRA